MGYVTYEPSERLCGVRRAQSWTHFCSTLSVAFPLSGTCYIPETKRWNQAVPHSAASERLKDHNAVSWTGPSRTFVHCVSYIPRFSRKINPQICTIQKNNLKNKPLEVRELLEPLFNKTEHP